MIAYCKIAQVQPIDAEDGKDSLFHYGGLRLPYENLNRIEKISKT